MDSAATTRPVSHAESPAELRARAAHARRRARTLIFYEAEPKLLAFADELDARAEAMEGSKHSTSMTLLPSGRG
jgi:hypothetical protein